MQRSCFALLASDCPRAPQPLPFAALSPVAPDLAAEALRRTNNGFVVLWVGVGTYVVLTLIRQVLPLRVSDPSEQQGLDINAHGEEAYNDEFTG